MKRFLLSTLTAGLAFGGAACSSGGAAVSEAGVLKPAAVSAAVLQRRSLADTITLTAEFRPYQEVDVYAKVAGYIQRISVDVGDRVTAGQVVALLEAPELLDELTRAEAAEQKSRIDVDRARSEVERDETDSKFRDLEYSRLAGVARSHPNLIAAQEVDSLKARSDQAKAQVDAMRAALSAAEQQVHVSAAARARVATLVDYLKIAAPFAGIVTHRYADTGAMIQAGTASQTQAKAVIRVAEDRVLRLVLPIPESAVTSIHVGSPVEIRVEAIHLVVHGAVARFTGQVHQATRTMEAEVDVPNGAARLKPGMFAHATIVVRRSENAVVIPVQAIKYNDGHPFALVVNSSRVESRRLKIGLETPESVEVLEGADEGEIVVIGSHGTLQPGQLVEPLFAKSPGLEAGN